MRDHFINELSSLIDEFPNIILITGDLGFGVLDDFRKNYPDNFINAGVAEQNMTGIATGMALEEKIVFTYSIANFPTLRCLEQIRNDACYHGVNVNIVSIGGGFSYGALGISHHATEDLSIMRSLPEITVVSPSSFWEVEQATEAIVQNKKVCYLRLDKSTGRDMDNNIDQPFVIGKTRTLAEGDFCTIFVTGGILEEVWEVHDDLQKLGQKICDVEIDNSKNWRNKHWRTISENYSKCLYFNKFFPAFENIFKSNWSNLSELNIKVISEILKILNINTKMLKASSINVEGNSTDLLINLCKTINCKKYLSGEGGKNYLQLDKFKSAGIEVVFEKNINQKPYKQNHSKLGFVQNLSIIDSLFNNGNKILDT